MSDWIIYIFLAVSFTWIILRDWITDQVLDDMDAPQEATPAASIEPEQKGTR